MIALVVVDTETGGLDPAQTCMIELAAQVVLVDEGRIEALEDPSGGTFYERIKPDRPVEDQAACVNGYTPEAWANATEPKQAIDAFRRWLEGHAKTYDRPMWCGSNPVFDVKFFNSDRKRHKVPEPGGLSYRLIDVQSMAMPLIYAGEIESVKLASLRQWAGLDGEQTHNALDDVLDTCQVLGALLERFGGS